MQHNESNFYFYLRDFRMLIEFSVTNFRSFRERQTFSMVAAPRLAHRGNVVKADIPGERNFPNLLKVAAIYGPNASGKSNLLKAMRVVQRLMIREPGSTEKLPVSPFRFDAALHAKPSEFEVHFIAGKKRYQFDLSATEDRIVEERLTSYPNGNPVVLYERRYEEDRGELYKFDQLEGGAELHQAWRKLTGPRTAFISQAVANSEESLKQLKAPHFYLSYQMMVVEDKLAGLANSVKNLVKSGSSASDDVVDFLQALDVPVTAVRVSEKNYESEESNALKNISRNRMPDTTTLTHTTALGSADFDFQEESDGTRGLFGFWLPWAIFGYDGGQLDVLIVDELDGSLHPEIVATLVHKYLKLERPTQLIFTTHDTHLMDTKLLRRDQFWITERDANGATKIRSVHEFEGREAEDLEKRYYEGRYRGLPYLRRV